MIWKEKDKIVNNEEQLIFDVDKFLGLKYLLGKLKKKSHKTYKFR